MQKTYTKIVAIISICALVSACADEVRIDSGGLHPPQAEKQKAAPVPYVLPEVQNELEGAFAYMEIDEKLATTFQQKLEHERGFEPEAYVAALTTAAQSSGDYNRVAQYMNIKCAAMYKALEGYGAGEIEAPQRQAETYMRSALSFSETEGNLIAEDAYALHVMMAEEMREKLSEDTAKVSELKINLGSCAWYLFG